MREHERIAGESHYPLAKMVNLAIDGITSLSVKPLRLISGLGIGVSVLSFVGVLWAVITQICGRTVTGWASTVCVICFMGGVQLVCLGVLGEYIGKIYMEVKARPRYIISERTWTKQNEDEEKRRIEKQMKISLIVPCYNEQEALPIFYRETKKVMESMDCDYEMIFVNDGSKDGTLGLLKEFAKEDDHVTYIRIFQKFWQGSCNVCRIL